MPEIDSFNVVVENLPRIYELTSQIAESPTGLPRTYQFGQASGIEGVFNEVAVGLKVYPDGYTLNLVAYYGKPDMGNWSVGEVNDLARVLTRQNPDSFVSDISHPQNRHDLVVTDFTYTTHSFIGLGWEDERSQWLGQLRYTDQLLRQEGYNPDYRESLEQDLDHLVHSPKPLPGTLSLMIRTTSFTTDPVRPQVAMPFSLEDYESFSQTVQRWSGFISHSINAISTVKGVQQVGRLTL